VETFRVPYYMAPTNAAPPYPKYLELRYPKVATKNPTVTVHLLDIGNLPAGASEVSFQSFPPNDLIAGEVAWVTDSHTHVIVLTYNHVQDQEKLVLVDVVASLVRERDARPGWIENNFAIQYISGTESYFDLSDESGWMHLYSYAVNGSTPTAITAGEWEVTSILNINSKTKTIYYQSTERDSKERHVYSISLDGTKKKAIVNEQSCWIMDCKFLCWWRVLYSLIQWTKSPPFKKLYSPKSTTTSIKTINDNAKLATALSVIDLPKVSWTIIDHPDGYSFNVMERLPPRFDSTKEYPVVFEIYGGPGSQQTTKSFRQVDFRAYLASDPELECIVLSVENRGTNYKGSDFRTVVAGQLGRLWSYSMYPTLLTILQVNTKPLTRFMQHSNVQKSLMLTARRLPLWAGVMVDISRPRFLNLTVTPFPLPS
jgi:dipeptidyl-peptidase-4